MAILSGLEITLGVHCPPQPTSGAMDVAGTALIRSSKPRSSHGVVRIECRHRAIEVLSAEDVPFRSMTRVPTRDGVIHATCRRVRGGCGPSRVGGDYSSPHATLISPELSKALCPSPSVLRPPPPPSPVRSGLPFPLPVLPGPGRSAGPVWGFWGRPAARLPLSQRHPKLWRRQESNLAGRNVRGGEFRTPLSLIP